MRFTSHNGRQVAMLEAHRSEACPWVVVDNERVQIVAHCQTSFIAALVRDALNANYERDFRDEEHPRAAAERRIVAQLSEAMLTKLAQRRHHGEWGGDVSNYMRWLFQETGELDRALDEYREAPTPETRAAVISECADIGNMAAMLIDVLREGDS